MGTKKTMLVLACALVMVFAMSTCAFAQGGPGGDRGGSDFNMDTFVTVIGIDYTDIDKTATVNNSNNSGVILQDSNGNDFAAIDDITLDLCLQTIYSGNTGSFNTMVNNYQNQTAIGSYNQADFSFTSTTNIGSNNTYDVDVTNAFNRSKSVSGTFDDQSFEFEVDESFNENNLINYQDQDGFDYDDNDLADIDAALWLNLGGINS